MCPINPGQSLAGPGQLLVITYLRYLPLHPRYDMNKMTTRSRLCRSRVLHASCATTSTKYNQRIIMTMRFTVQRRCHSCVTAAIVFSLLLTTSPRCELPSSKMAVFGAALCSTLIGWEVGALDAGAGSLLPWCRTNNGTKKWKHWYLFCET